MKASRSILRRAIEREDWEAAALCLALGVVRAARKLPPDALEDMIDQLSAEDKRPHPHRRRRRDRR
jgi:hypothetical protein